MVVDSPQTGGNSQNNCDFELIHNYVTNRNVNISQTVTKQIVISSKKSPKKIPTVFEEISSSKGAPSVYDLNVANSKRIILCRMTEFRRSFESSSNK